jgi:hypothetical protein
MTSPATAVPVTIALTNVSTPTTMTTGDENGESMEEEVIEIDDDESSDESTCTTASVNQKWVRKRKAK